MDTFTVNYMENVAHAHPVDTRPSLPLPLPQSEGLGTRLIKIKISSPLSTDLPTIIRVRGHDYAPASIFCMILDCIYSDDKTPSDDN